MFDCLIALVLALVLPITACTGSQGTDPAPPPPDSTVPAPQDSTVMVPRGGATLDGTLSAGEWSGAYVALLTGGGQVLLMHDGGYLYLGVQRREALVVTVCLDRGDSVAVFHSSAALGTAAFRRAQNRWNLTRGFTWELRDSTMSTAAQREREAFLLREGWVATNAYVGAGTDTEFKIAIPSGRARLAVVPMSVGQNYEETAWWPGRLADGCRARALLTGAPPAQLQFAPDSWITVVARP